MYKPSVLKNSLLLQELVHSLVRSHKQDITPMDPNVGGATQSTNKT